MDEFFALVKEEPRQNTESQAVVIPAKAGAHRISMVFSLIRFLCFSVVN